MVDDKDFAKRIVSELNTMLANDGEAVSAMMAYKVPCNDQLADHPTCQVKEYEGQYRVGMLGVLNGVCGIKENGRGYIQAVFDESTNRVVHFRVDEE